MALNLGELVAGLRADEGPFLNSLTTAQLAMRGLTRDVDGRLRDMDGRFRTEGEAMGNSLAYLIGRGARMAGAALAKLGVAATGIGVGIPVAAALGTALGGVAAGAVAAGLAAGAFKTAAQPQLELMKESATAADKLAKAQENEARKKALAAKLKAQGSDLAEKAEKAYTTARLATKDAEAAYQRQTKGLPKATAEAALAQAKLKTAHEEWSASLASSTMPVFTKGMELLRGLLPTLTPFVKAAAGAFGGFLDSVARGVKSARFKEWADDMSAAAGPALTNFLTVIKNVAVGFGGLMQAFLPASDNMTGGLVKMSQAFADWGTSLKGSEGFEQFLTLAREGGATLGQLALAAGNLLVALGPLIGVTTQVALALARFINALPPEVLSTLATALAAVAVGMKVYAAGAAVATAANRVMATSTYTAIAGWTRMMAVGLMAYARIAGAAVLSAARTAAAWAGAALRSMATFALQMVRTAAIAVAQFAMMAARAIAWAATMAAQWLIAMGPIGWIIAAVIGLVALVVANWDTVKQWTLTVWGYVVGFIKGAIDNILSVVQGLAAIPGRIASWFGAAKDWAIRKFVELTVWMAGLAGRIGSAISGLAGTLRTAAANAFQRFRDAAAQKASAMISWVRGLPGRISSGIGSLGSLLYSKGVSVVTGLWNGIKSMGGWIKGQLIGWAKSMIPGPIAKALGIASPSKVTKAQGRWIARGLIEGLTGSSKQIKKASTRLADIIRDSLKPGRRRSKALARVSSGTKQLMKLATQEGRLAERLKAASKRLADQVKARDKLVADVRKGVLEGADITKQDTGGWPQTAESILAGLKQDTAAAQQFAKNLATLRKKGVRSDLIAQIAQAGVEGGSASAAALANANSGQIKQINAQQAALVTAAGKAGTTAGNAMYGAGIAAGKGLVAGLKMQQKNIEKQMLRIAQGMSKAIRKALGIKSPSRVMAAIGRFIPQGLVAGIEAERPAVDRTMRNLVSTPSPSAAARSGSWDSASSRARAGAAQRVVLELRSSGRSEDNYIVERVRRGIRKKAGGDVDLALVGRRSG